MSQSFVSAQWGAFPNTSMEKDNFECWVINFLCDRFTFSHNADSLSAMFAECMNPVRIVHKLPTSMFKSLPDQVI